MMLLTVLQLTSLLLLSSIAAAAEDKNLDKLLSNLNNINTLDIPSFTYTFLGAPDIEAEYTLFLNNSVLTKHNKLSIKTSKISDDTYIIDFNKIQFTSEGPFALSKQSIYGLGNSMGTMNCEINISPSMETSINVTTDTVVLDRNKFRLRLEFELPSPCPALMDGGPYLISDLNAKKDQILLEYNADIADYLNNKFMNGAYDLGFNKFLLVVFMIYHLANKFY